mmetsp:Transcript_19146/g.18794  ORF Transcript_19146/g.18794 Transcript_19146/m.18794 type:complete len:183 (-) Transcript_19146:301-849(-)
MSGYTDDHSNLLKRYLKFFNLKKESAFKEVKLSLGDIREDSLDNAVFTKADVEGIFSKIEEEVVSTFRDELDRFYKMSGVFVQMLLHDAEKQDANINAEVSFMENYKALEEIKQFEEEKEALSLPSMVNKVSKMASKLPTLLDKDENKQLQFQNKQLMTENESLKKKIAFQEKKLIDSLKEK